MIVDPDPKIVQPISKTAREAIRKLARAEQRLIVVNWATLANNSIEAFTRETTLKLFSTKGRRLRALDRGDYRRLTNQEFALLWNLVREHLDGRGVKLTVGKIEIGLKAVGLIAPMPGKAVSR